MEIVFNNKSISADFESWQTAFNGDSKIRKRQWGQDNAPDRSARCLAHYICEMSGMNKIQDAIKDICGSISVNTIYPEAPVKFDGTRGSRRHDLAFFSDDKKVFVSVEAKVEETFGQTIKAWLKGGNSEDRKKRRDSLMGFFGVDDDSLYNQLLFGLKSTITGVLSTAGNEISLNNGVDYHIMLVLVFVTPDANLNKIEKNKEKFDEFVKAINATKVDSCTSCECYKKVLEDNNNNNFIAYKMVEYPVKCGQ